MSNMSIRVAVRRTANPAQVAWEILGAGERRISPFASRRYPVIAPGVLDAPGKPVQVQTQ